MLDEVHPDVVAVTGPDASHAAYIIAALGRNVDVLTEKPMTSDCAQTNAVLQADAASDATLRVMHNARYRSPHVAIKRLIREGRVGRITNVEFVHNLDTYHGASYFYRWNRRRANSGGLTVTEGCHRFDLLNWWVDDTPEEVFAYGALNYYGPHGTHRPRNQAGQPLPPAEERAACPYNRRWSAPGDDIVSSRLQAGGQPSYPREYPADRPMYIYDEDIDIEDTYSAVIRYRGGSSVSFSMNASSPWEGYRLAINGTEGRIETTAYVDPNRCPFPTERQTITYIPLFGQREVHEVGGSASDGGHGDSDIRLKQEIFIGAQPENAGLDLRADAVAGGYAVAVGEAIWRSVASGRPIKIDELISVLR
jgi:predicted dehydrogenase